MCLPRVTALFSVFIHLTISDFVCDVQDTCKDQEIVALVLARAGSKGVKHKNLAALGNETLLSRTLRVVHEAQRFEEVWVSTDGEAVAKEATSHGARIHYRHPDTATDTATSISAVQEFLKYHSGVQVIALIQCTSPWSRPEYLQEAHRLIVQEDVDCVFSATRSHKLRWTEDADGFVRAVNFNPSARPRRQDWSGELVENGMFYFARAGLVRKGSFQNSRCRVVEVPEEHSMEIDTEFDLELARLLLDLQSD